MGLSQFCRYSMTAGQEAKDAPQGTPFQNLPRKVINQTAEKTDSCGGDIEFETKLRL